VQTVAMGLLIVILDVPPTGWDWVADPFGWVLVLLGLSAVREEVPNHRGLSITAWLCLAVSVVIYPPGSVVAVDDSLGWVFSVPTVVWCFLVCDALRHVAAGGRRTTLLWLRNAFVVVLVLPLLVYLAGLEWLTVPTAVLAVGANVALLYLLWTTETDEEESEPAPDNGAGSGSAAEPGADRPTTVRPWQTPEREKERQREQRRSRAKRQPAQQQVTGAEVVARVRKRRRSS
jgi:hypothetical protein